MNKEQFSKAYNAQSPEAVLREELRILSNTLDAIKQFIGKQINMSQEALAGVETMPEYAKGRMPSDFLEDLVNSSQAKIKALTDLQSAIQSIEQVCRNSKQR